MIALPLALLLAGCGPSDAELSATGAPPEAGWYELRSAAVTEWTCAGDAPQHDGEADRTSSLAEITLGPDGTTLTWRWADAYDPLPCEVDGSSFHCLVYATARTEGEEPDACARVEDERWIVGEWTSPGHIRGQQVRNLACQGDACDTAADAYGADFAFPCDGAREFVAALVEE